MPKRPYKPSGRSDPGAASGLVWKAMLAGVVTGAVEAFVGQWFSLFVLFPIVIGGVVGVVASTHVAAARVRAPLVAGAIAFLGGALGQVTVHYGEYVLFRGHVIQELRAAPEPGQEPPDDDAASGVVDAFLAERTGHAGFIGYLVFDADRGTQVKKAGHDDGLTFSGIGAWLLWLAELLLAAGMAGWLAFDEARKPFCEHCGHWYDTTTDLAVGSGVKKDVKALAAVMERESWGEVAGLLGAPTEKEACTLAVESCSTCADHERRLTLTRVVGLNAKPQPHVAYRTMLTDDAFRTLAAGLERRPPPSAASDTAAPTAG